MDTQASQLLPPELLDTIGQNLHMQQGTWARRQLRGPLQAALGVDRGTLWRWTARHAPRWVLFALLGVVVSAGNRQRAAALLDERLAGNAPSHGTARRWLRGLVDVD